MRSDRVKERNRKHRLCLITLGLLPISVLLLTLASGCGKVKVEAPKEESLAVSTTTPKTQTLVRSIDQPGVLMSYEETPIYSKIPGYLQTVNVDIGDKITKGELLGELWVPEIEKEVHVRQRRVEQGKADVTQAEENLKVAEAFIVAAEAKVRQAKASLGRAEAFRERWQKEYERDKDYPFLDPKTLQEAEHQLDAAKRFVEEVQFSVKSADAAWSESIAQRDKADADVKVAKARLIVWKRQLEEQKRWFEYAHITSPYDGIVTRRNIHTGHFVQPANSGTTSKAAEPLFVVMRTDLMRVVVPVPEYDAPLVKDGAKAIVRLQAYRGEEIVDKVERSSWSLDKNDRTLRVEIWLKNPKNELHPFMYGNISIFATLPNTLCLPAESVLTDGYNRYCFIVEDGKARRVNIRIGITNDRMTEVLEKQLPPTSLGAEGAWAKFAGNEQVITSNLKSIQDGQPVVPKG